MHVLVYIYFDECIVVLIGSIRLCVSERTETNKPPLKRGSHFLIRERYIYIAAVPLLSGVLLTNSSSTYHL